MTVHFCKRWTRVHLCMNGSKNLCTKTDDRRICKFSLWLACRTQDEIADTEDIPRETVRDRIGCFGEIGHLAKFAKVEADHAVDFDVPIYNIWKQQTKSEGSNHFGNSESRWLDNLPVL